MSFDNIFLLFLGIILLGIIYGQTKQIAILFVLIAVGICLKRNFKSPRELVNKVKEQFTNSYQYKNNEDILTVISKKLPNIYDMENVKNKFHLYLKKYVENENTEEYATILDLQIEYYFNIIYHNINDIYLNKTYPQQNFISMLNNKYQLNRTFENFIYIIPNTSHLPDDLKLLITEFESAFKIIVIQISEELNTYKEDEVNTHTNFVPYFNEPMPKNVYYDNTGLYV